MNSIGELLRGLCPEVEEGLRPHLENWIEGAVIRSGLPQNWVFKTERETVTFHVSNEGKAQVTVGGAKNPDVTIQWNHDYLVSVLTNRSSVGIPQGPMPGINKHTTKGVIGFDLLRKHLGL